MATPADRRPRGADASYIGSPPPTYEDRTGLANLIRRNPGGWGVALGAAVVGVSVFLPWIELTDTRTGATDRVRALESFSGQTLLLVALLTAGLGFVVALATTRRWRIILATLCLLLGGLLVGAAAWTLLDPAGFAQHAVEAQLFATATARWHAEDASARLTEAFASGSLAASALFGVLVGLAGGILTMIGAVLSFSARSVDSDR